LCRPKWLFARAEHDLRLKHRLSAHESVGAKLAQGKEARIAPDEGASIVLQPPEPGLFARFQRKIDSLGIDHLRLVHPAITEPVSSELTTTYLLFTRKDQAAAILYVITGRRSGREIGESSL
jgi:hypothetical protein